MKKKNTFKKWGRNNLMALAAFRYCLGRSSYIVSDCVDWLIANWDEFDISLKKVIQFEIQEEIEAATIPMMDCDLYEWKRVLGLKNE